MPEQVGIGALTFLCILRIFKMNFACTLKGHSVVFKMTSFIPLLQTLSQLPSRFLRGILVKLMEWEPGREEINAFSW